MACRACYPAQDLDVSALKSLDHCINRLGRVKVRGNDLGRCDADIILFLELADNRKDCKRIQNVVIDQCFTGLIVRIRLNLFKDTNKFFHSSVPPFESVFLSPSALFRSRLRKRLMPSVTE